ncbi:MAG: EF-P lysine aminoacylase EpmA [Cardiobacteriaceae bacterium]|nr:EF-P lysine aminoacylase EpmA [Cardiobacteriaceae bacterium]
MIGQTRDYLVQRANMIASVRDFFAKRQVLEVDTVMLTPAGNPEPNLANVQTQDGSYLHTSPEFAMKTLLSYGSGDIFQLCHVFRDEEVGQRHLREFMMLEWYRLGFNHEDLMAEVATLVKILLPHYQDFGIEQLDYEWLFEHYVGLRLGQTSDEQLKEFCAKRFVGSERWNLSRDGYLDLLFSHEIQPRLGQSALSFVVNYPSSQASLARLIEVDGQTKAARFELFIKGLELCNGFWELTNRMEQQKRFEDENQRRAELGLPEVLIDEQLLAALERGLPDCAGVAVGFDRVVMLRMGVTDIRELYV